MVQSPCQHLIDLGFIGALIARSFGSDPNQTPRGAQMTLGRVWGLQMSLLTGVLC
jgi:hypothetical protein